MRHEGQAIKAVPKRTLSRLGAQEKGPKVPAYIVTFSDMVTLLLTFFVMLLTLAEVQDPELFNKGRDSFWKSLRYCGLGTLFGKKVTLGFGETKIKHLTSNPDSSSEIRTIDARQEKIRRIFEKISRSMTAMPSQIVAERTNFSVTNIRFSPGEAALDEPAKRFLTEFCLDLQQTSDFKTGTLYVLGLAGNEATEKQQWMLSARRAWTVGNFLQETLSGPPSPQSGVQTPHDLFEGPPQWRVFWWGAGPGGDWVGQDSLISKQSQISIAVLRTSD